MSETEILENLNPGEILSLTIIGEARGEPIQGQVAVGCVIRNRMLSNPGKYKSYKDVCLEPKQFSCWNEDDPNRDYLLDLGSKLLFRVQIPGDQSIVQCVYVAQGIVNRAIMDNTNGSIHYMTKELFDSNTVSWAKNVKSFKTIGKQVFFNV